MRKSLIFILLLPFFLVACTRQEPYIGFHYRNAIVNTDPISQQRYLTEGPRFSTIQSCLNWGNNILASTPGDGFECSTGCQYDEEIQALVCKDTTKLITKFGKGGSYDYER